MGLKQEKDI